MATAKKKADQVEETEVEETDEPEHIQYDLKVTAEDRGYQSAEEPQLAPENELREDPRDPDSPKSVNDDSEDDDSEEEDDA